MAINLAYKLRRIEEVRAAARKRSKERYRRLCEEKREKKVLTSAAEK